jgi:hypothetical protein
MLLQTFNVPVGAIYSTIWHVFSLRVENGRYTIVPRNTLSNTPTSPANVGRNTVSSGITPSGEQPVYLSDEEIAAKAAAELEAGIIETEDAA